MAMEIVNGYPCRDCTDAEKAKKGITLLAGQESVSSSVQREQVTVDQVPAHGER